MFYCKFSKCSLVTKTLKAIYKIFRHITINITKNGFIIKELDDEDIYYLILDINDQEYLDYRWTEDTTIRINLEELLKIVEISNDNIEMIVEDEEIKIVIEKNIEFNITNLEENDTELEIYTKDYVCEFEVNYFLYLQMIKSLKTIKTDLLEIILNENLTWRCVNDQQKVNIGFQKTEKSKVKFLNKKNPTRSSKYKLNHGVQSFHNYYDKKYFVNILDLVKIGERINIGLNDNQPISIDILLNDSTGSYCSYFVAPKLIT